MSDRLAAEWRTSKPPCPHIHDELAQSRGANGLPTQQQTTLSQHRENTSMQAQFEEKDVGPENYRAEAHKGGR